jgi:hypothetical protein
LEYGGRLVITQNTNIVSVLELKRLLYALKDLRPDICIRFRLMGEMWQVNHLRIVNIREKGVTLKDEELNELVVVPELNNVMQFELDRAFQQYQPHFHYPVDPAFVF